MKRYITSAMLLLIAFSSTMFGYEVGDVYSIDGIPVGIVFYVNNAGNSGLVVSKQEYEGKFYTSNPGLGWTMATTRKQAYDKIEANGIDKYNVYLWCTELGEGWLIPTVSDYKKIFELWNGSSSPVENIDAQAEFNTAMEEIGGTGIFINYNAEYNHAEDTPSDAYWACNADATRWGLQAFKFQENDSWGTAGDKTRRARAVYEFRDENSEPDPDVVNIALNKPATTSGEHDSGLYPGAKAVDGNTNDAASRWISDDTEDEHWLEVDLEGSFVITSVEVFRDLWNNQTQKNPTFQFQIWDATIEEWQTLFSVEDNITISPWVEVFEYQVITEKVRYYVPAYQDNRARLWELIVNGYPYKNTGVNKVTIDGPSDLIKQIRVYNLQGSLVYVENVNVPVSVLTPKITVPGIYIVKAISERGMYSYKWFVK